MRGVLPWDQAVWRAALTHFPPAVQQTVRVQSLWSQHHIQFRANHCNTAVQTDLASVRATSRQAAILSSGF